MRKRSRPRLVIAGRRAAPPGTKGATACARCRSEAFSKLRPVSVHGTVHSAARHYGVTASSALQKAVSPWSKMSCGP